VATDTDQAPDLSIRRVAHIVGIGGPGMSAIAVVLADMGHTVSGSDVVESPAVERLRGLGIAVAIGHRAENIPADADFVAISTAVAADNLEVAVALEQGVPVVRRDSLLPAIAATRRTVAVAGTHGKTTTSSMLAVILRDSHLHPSFLIGGEVVQLATNAAWDVGDWFVLEADESDGSGFAVPHEALIVTNIEPDHLEFHGTVENLHDVFEEFIASTTGPCLVCADDPVASRLGRSHGARTYGLAADADIRMVDLEGTRAGSSFGVVMDSVPTGTIELPIAGAHNAVNACAALAMALELGVSFVDAATALAGFGGVGRRFEQRGEVGGITFIDDYAHLPTEIAAAISAARDGGWGRVVAVFQPHRYSRTQSLWRDFADAFIGSDLLVLTDVYAAGEAPREGVTGKLLVDAVLDSHPRQRVAYVPDRAGLATFLAGQLRGGDVCLTLGAGDVTRVADEVIALLTARGAS
jgi:UDP-N-acetylmuramate--alanine ligase